jgi:hypothetical protein
MILISVNAPLAVKSTPTLSEIVPPLMVKSPVQFSDNGEFKLVVCMPEQNELVTLNTGTACAMMGKSEKLIDSNVTLNMLYSLNKRLPTN